MEFNFDAKAVGLRIKNARNAKGWSQSDLAEKMNTTAQNISKFERDGITNMEYITLLSNILETNLLKDVIDSEGPVGELGREILYQLVMHYGNCEMSDLEQFYMYGLSEAQITNEIVKLAKIGLIVREKYLDFSEEPKDTVFITAKGIITLKNMQLNTSQSLDIDNKVNWHMTEVENEFGSIDEMKTPDAKSYEEFTGSFDSYGEYIQYHKENDVENILRNLSVTPLSDKSVPYRSFFISYLKSKFQEDYELTDEWLNIPLHNNFYSDCISRMIFGMNDNAIKKYIKEWDDISKENEAHTRFIRNRNPIYDTVEDELEQSFTMWECVMDYDLDDYDDDSYQDFEKIEMDYYLEQLELFANKFKLPVKDPLEVFSYVNLLKPKMTEAEKDYFMDLYRIKNYFTRGEHSQPDIYVHNGYKNALKTRGVKRLSDLYSDEQIKDFVLKNFRPAENEEEEAIDNILKGISSLCPESLDYFKFPKSWEENGLAEYIRNTSGLF